MPRDRAYTLGELTTEFVYIECRYCPRRGRYRVANIIAKYGADMDGPSFLNAISADCASSADVHDSGLRGAFRARERGGKGDQERIFAAITRAITIVANHRLMHAQLTKDPAEPLGDENAEIAFIARNMKLNPIGAITKKFMCECPMP
jgi:hypothetical protein